MRAPVIKIALAAITMLIGHTPTHAQDAQDRQTVPDKPELTVRVVPPEPYLQEQIIQTIRVVAAHAFEELVLDLPPVEGADIITLQQPKTRKFKTYGGEGYIYETRRAIFPKASGELRLAPVRVSGSVGISREEKESFALKSKPVLLDIKPPPGDFSAPTWVVARKVEIEEHWSKPLDQLRVGDHVTHTVKALVTGVTGAHLPELDHGRSTGLTILPGQSERSTEVTPNEVIGKIRRSFELRVDVDQPINISPVRLVWWNTDTEIEWRSAAKAVRLEPLPRDVESLVQTLMDEARETHKAGRYGVMALTILGGLALAAVAIWLLTRRRRHSPEDRVLLEAMSENPDPIKAVSAFLAWGEAAFPEDGSQNHPMSLERLSQKLGAPAGHHLNMLQKAAFAPSDEDVDMLDLAKKVIAAVRSQRGRSLSDIQTGIARHLLGPKQHLPRIDGGFDRTG